MDKDGSDAATLLPEAPNGMYPARVDDKGRLKLPVVFQAFFASLPERKLFVTSLDRRIGQIFSISVWRENKKFLNDFTADRKAARQALFNANDLGADTEMDSQGRIQLPPELRRELGIENQSVYLCAYRGRVEVYSETIYAARKQEAAEITREDLDRLEGAGLL